MQCRLYAGGNGDLMDTILSFHDVRFAYEDDAWTLSVPSLELGRERVTCIVGPNGSGKSTLLRTAAGILNPAEGRVCVGDKPLAYMPRRTIARSIGFLPQASLPLFDYSVESVARMGRYAHVSGIGLMTEEDNRVVENALSAVAMQALRSRPLSHLSGGEQRRALIASVLAQDPELLLLDEPTAALDVHHAVAVMRLLSDFEAYGPSVVIVTHDINLASLFGERLLLMIDGRVHADGPPSLVVSAEVLREAYGTDVLVRQHPESGGPMVIPRRRAEGDTA